MEEEGEGTAADAAAVGELEVELQKLAEEDPLD